MLIKIIFSITLFLFWLILSSPEGSASLPILSLISISAIIYISHIMDFIPNYYKFPKLVRYLVWLVKEIITSSFTITKIMWSRKMKINPEILEINSPFEVKSANMAIYTNSITTTPGTITIGVEGDKIFVHCFTNSEKKGVLSNDTANKIKDVFLV